MYIRILKAIIILMILSTPLFAQKVYQSGAYPGQRLRPGSTVIKGVLADKFSSNGYFWYHVVHHDQVYKISVMKADFDQAEIQSPISLNNCFVLSSRKWKCEPIKRKSTFMDRNVFFADFSSK